MLGLSIELPNGTWWLDKATHNTDVVYGDHFVLQRPKTGGPGLVLSPQLTSMQLLDHDGDESRQLAVRPPTTGSYHLASYATSDQEVDITDWSFVVDEHAPDLAVRQLFQLPGAAFAPTNCVGIVRHACNDEWPAEAEHILNSKHPRRTKKIQFTCNLCRTSNTKAVNPHAWTDGSVFARCEGCHVIHKLVDNLNIFHELAGPIFPPRTLRNLKIPKGLPQVPAFGYFNPIKDNL